jgi:DNA-binding IclR family transcriptional regulator
LPLSALAPHVEASSVVAQLIVQCADSHPGDAGSPPVAKTSKVAPPEVPAAGTGGAQVVRRAIAVLRAVAGAEEGSRLSDIAAAIGLHVATTHRLLSVLADEGLVEYDKRSRLYHLGSDLFALAAADKRRQSFLAFFRPVLMRLAAETGDTVYFSVRSGDEALCLARFEGPFPIRTLTLDVGDRRPLGVGAGSLALLAFLEPADVDRVSAASAHEYARFGVSVEEVRGFVDKARALGYALNDSRILPGMTAFGLPVRTASGRVAAAISIAAISQRMQPPRLEEMVERVRNELQRLPPLPG